MLQYQLELQEKIKAGKIIYLGGDGSSFEKAILISGDIKSKMDGITAEYYYLFNKHGHLKLDWDLLCHSLVQVRNDRFYDSIEIKDLKTHGHSKYTFDITEFYGKLY